MLKTIEEVFKSNLKRLRGNRTQEEISELSDIPLRSYQHMESTGAFPQGKNRERITKFHKVTEVELFVDRDEYGPKRRINAQEALSVLAEFIEKGQAPILGLSPTESAVLERVVAEIKADPEFIETLLTTLPRVEAAVDEPKDRPPRKT